MTVVTQPRRYVLSDGKGRPNWADDETWALFEATNEVAFQRGFSGMACGWAMQPRPHGEYRVSVGSRAITVSEATPQEAVVTMAALLERMP